MGLGGVAGPVVCPPHTRWDAGNRVVFQTIYSQPLLNRPRGTHIQTHIPVHSEDKTGPPYTLLALNYLHQCPSHCFLMPYLGHENSSVTSLCPSFNCYLRKPTAPAKLSCSPSIPQHTLAFLPCCHLTLSPPYLSPRMSSSSYSYRNPICSLRQS